MKHTFKNRTEVTLWKILSYLKLKSLQAHLQRQQILAKKISKAKCSKQKTKTKLNKYRKSIKCKS